MWFPLTIALAALLDSVNPCAFSVLFLSIAFLFNLGRSRGGIVVAGLFYIAGIFVVYMGIGLGLLQVLSVFNIPHGLAKVGAIILITFGLLDLADAFIPNFPIKLKIPTFAHPRIAKIMHRSSLPAMLVLGAFVGLFEFPCTGGPYLFVLGLLHDQATFWTGLGYLLLYNLIFVLPLVVALFLVANRRVLGRLDEARQRGTKKARAWIALATVILGLLIIVF